MTEREPQSCADCPYQDWCLPEQAEFHRAGKAIDSFPCALEQGDVEAYQGRIEWHRYTDGKGRLFRFGLIELSDKAGKHFVGGANGKYKLVVVLDMNGIGHAYPFKVGDGKDNDYLSPEYVYEKLGRALYFRQDVLTFTQRLAQLLNRPTVVNGEKGEDIC